MPTTAGTAVAANQSPVTRFARSFVVRPTPAPVPAPTPPRPPAATRPAALVSGFLAAVGLAPSLTPRPTPPPAPAPFAWAVLGFVRRELEQQVHQIQRTFFNRTPVATNDTAQTDEDKSVKIMPLTNDIDADGDALTVVVTQAPTHGTLTPNRDGSFVYAPDPNFNGTDSFTYTVSDEGSAPHIHGLRGLLTGGGHTDTTPATVTITVAAVNDAPTAVDHTASVGEDDSDGEVINLITDSSDPDAGDTRSVAGIAKDATGVPATSLTLDYGTVTLNANGTATYTPDDRADQLPLGGKGTDTFTYTIKDVAGATDTATVTVTINGENDSPTADNEEATAPEDGPPVTIDLLRGDTDPDTGDVLRITGITRGTTTAGVGQTLTLTYGSVTLNENGTATYTPDPDRIAAGDIEQDTFQYTLADGQGGNAAGRVTVTVSGVNFGTVISTGEDTPLEVEFGSDGTGFIRNQDGSLTEVRYDEDEGWVLGANYDIGDAGDFTLDDQLTYAYDRDDDSLALINRENGEVDRALDARTGLRYDFGGDVTDVAVDRRVEGQVADVYLVDSEGRVSAVDTTTRRVLTTETRNLEARSISAADAAAVSTSPRLAVSGKTVYVANGDRISVVRKQQVSARLSAEGDEVATEELVYAGDLDIDLEPGDEITAIEVGDDGALYATVVNTASTDASARGAAVATSRLVQIRVDAEGSVRSVSSVDVGRGAESISINDDLDRAYVLNGEDRTMSVVGLRELVLLDTVQTGDATGVVVAPGTNTVLVTNPGARAVAVVTDTAVDPDAPITITLDWGSQPQDLDVHLVGSTNSETVDVSYRHPTWVVGTETAAFLDVDDRDGDGPEIIQIDTRIPGTYLLYIDNFSNNDQLTASKATVTVSDQKSAQIVEFSVPSTGTERYWSVFTLEIAEDGTVTIDAVGDEVGEPKPLSDDEPPTPPRTPPRSDIAL